MTKAKFSTIAIFCRAADVQEKLHTEALEKCEKDFTNADFEAQADEAYKDYYNACKELSEMIVEVTEGQVDKNTALHMAFEKRKEIENLIYYK